MKKICVLLISLFTVLIVSGCGNSNVKVLSCSSEIPGNKTNAGINIEYTFKDDRLTKENMQFTFKYVNVDNLSYHWDTVKTQFTEQNEPVEEEGYKKIVKSDDKNYIFTVIIEIDFEKISKETMEKYDIEDYSSKTYDEFKKETMSDGIFTCK